MEVSRDELLFVLLLLTMVLLGTKLGAIADAIARLVERGRPPSQR